MLLTGTFIRAVDEKQRIAIPKHFRDAFESGEPKGLYLAPGTDGSLAMYPAEAFSRLAARLAEVPPAAADARAFSRLFYARAEYADLDGQGRVRIPQALAELAGLEKEAVLLGVHDHLELWEKQRWERYLHDKGSQYDQIAERAFGNMSPKVAAATE